MNRERPLKPFGFRIFTVVLLLMILACADTQEVADPGPQDQNYASISRTDGLAYGHFSSNVSIYCTYFSSTTAEWITGLPAGFTYSDRVIQGDDPGPGQWAITLHWKGIDTRTGVEGEWKQNFELRFFTKLEER